MLQKRGTHQIWDVVDTATQSCHWQTRRPPKLASSWRRTIGAPQDGGSWCTTRTRQWRQQISCRWRCSQAITSSENSRGRGWYSGCTCLQWSSMTTKRRGRRGLSVAGRRWRCCRCCVCDMMIQFRYIWRRTPSICLNNCGTNNPYQEKGAINCK